MTYAKKLIAQDFNQAAKIYDQYANIQQQVTDILCNKYGAHLIDAKKLLDLGSGTGYFKEALPITKPIFSLDIAHQMCRTTNNRDNTNLSINADIEYLPVKPHSFDTIFSSLTIQWLQYLDRSFDQIFTALKPGGSFIYSTLGTHTLQELNHSYKQIGLDHPTLSFTNKEIIQEEMAIRGLESISINEEIIKVNYKDLRTLMRSLKAIGARNKSNNNKVMSKGVFNMIESCYKNNFGTEKGIIASWHIIYGHAKK